MDESGGFDPRWDSVRWSGPAGVAVLWVGIGGAVRRSGFSLLGDQPLSRMGENDRVARLFTGSLVVAALLFLAFGAFVSRAHAAGWPFTVLMAAGMLGQLVAGVVPIGPVGSSDPTHVIAGLILGGTIPCFLLAYASTRPPGRRRAIAWRLAGLQVASTVVGIALSRAGVAALAEILPAVTFHAWVLAVATHRPSPNL